jgi:methyl-accepting chemotaxis protein/methyl-accepting chemotaxis protein-1 (serine sensor receptor)
MDTAAGSLWDRTHVAAQIRTLTEQAFLAEKTSLVNAMVNNTEQERQWREKEIEGLNGVAGEIGKMPALTYEASRQAMERIRANQAAWRQIVPRVNELVDHGKAADAQRLSLKEVRPLYDAMSKDAALISTNIDRVMADLKTSGQQTYTGMQWAISGLVLLGMVMGSLALWVVRGMVSALRNTVTELNAGGEQVASASTQIASTSQTLSQGASEQAASVEEISASMEEMTAMAKRNGDSSAEATAMMAETAKQVEHSHVALGDMVASMSAIKESSEKVAKINKTIDEIAFQTNILALNAAVEAARAGEAGMGFAVVADEVRNLAQRSAVAAKDTAALIEESIANSSQGADRLEQVSTAIRGITESTSKVKNLLDEVNESSKQQGLGITQVSTAIQQVSTVTQTSAASAEESAAAAQELSAQSQKVRDLVNVLAVMVEGGAAGKAPEKPVRRSLRSPAAASGPVKKSSATKYESAKTEDDPFPMETSEHESFRSF